jgi:adenylosuccinate lyase
MNAYVTPLGQRYASKEMLELFSTHTKFTTWRRLWVALAKAEQALGLPITDEQIAQLEAHIDDVDEQRAGEFEKQTRHDVMAHVMAYGEQCPLAQPIIHLGATSCYVGDNTDLIILRRALELIRDKLVNVLDGLGRFALRYKDLPTLGFTHFQPAQPTTVGKRATLWMQDLLLDLEELEHRIATIRFRGVKGTTGTQASFLELFAGDHEKVRRLDAMVAQAMGFDRSYPVTGQTYSRKVDAMALDTLSGIAQSAHKFSNDIRLLQHLKEVEEPFAAHQIGSSAMPYKRNPMRSERMASLARYVIADALNPAMTAAEQWLERTLDDSANKRISVPEAFLATDAILELYLDVGSGLVVNEPVIRNRLLQELPFMAMENIMMDAVKRGGDRQILHGRIRDHSVEAARRVKQGDGVNDMLQRIAADPAFGMTEEALSQLMDPALYVGRAPQQVEEFLASYANPALDRYRDKLGMQADVQV